MTIIAAVILGVIAAVSTHDLTRGLASKQYREMKASRDRCEEKVKASELYAEMKKEAVQTPAVPLP